MDVSESNILVVGGTGLIDSHLVEELIEEDVKEIVVYDNFRQGIKENLTAALKDPKVNISPREYAKIARKSSLLVA